MARPCIEGCNRLARNGPRCETCRLGRERQRNTRRRGAHTWGAATARRQLNRAGWGICANCNTAHPARHLEVDHITPLADGGTDTLDNIQTLCGDCHRTKTDNEHRQRTARRH